MDAQDSTENHLLKLQTIKHESHDTGYQSSSDTEMRMQDDPRDYTSQQHIPLPPFSHFPIKQENRMLKPEPVDDPYSFVEDDPLPPPMQLGTFNPPIQQGPKKRGRKKKSIVENGIKDPDFPLDTLEDSLMKKKHVEVEEHFKERKKHDRFNGMPESEVVKRTLPDHMAPNLDILIVGINPGLYAAYKGHHYAGPGNHFWKCLYLSGLIPEPMSADDDFKLIQYGIGFTNMVHRPTKGSADLTKKEIREGGLCLTEKLQKFKPKIAVFNGKGIFEVYSGKKDFMFGRQPGFVEGTSTYIWVMPSSSARCAQLPRATDKVPFYAALKKFRDYLNGIIPEIKETEVVFADVKLKNYCDEKQFQNVDSKEELRYCDNSIPNGELTDLTNATIKKEDSQVGKKKRGRPKKIKTGEQEIKHEKNVTQGEHKNGEAPKKKRGRPKKLKPENSALTNGLPEQNGMASPMASPNCFSPHQMTPPNSYCQPQPNFSPSYNNQAHVYNTQNPGHSPVSVQSYHQSPITPHQYNQSPPPPSQAFNHSDLSSEISAAISSEHNLGSPSPTSPSLGPPDFEPPTSMPDELADTSQNPLPQVKEDPSGEVGRECHFSNPTTPNDSQNMNYQNYNNYPTDSQPSSSVVYSQNSGPEYEASRSRTPQDVATKSISGLECLVDQIPNIADHDSHSQPQSLSNPSTPSHAGPFSPAQVPTSQYNNGHGYIGYPNSSHSQYSTTPSSSSGSYSPQYSSSTNYSANCRSSSYSPHLSSASSNFSVSALANSSATSTHESFSQVSSSFSVTSLSSNYSSMNSTMTSYPNLMGSPHSVGSPMMGSTSGMGTGMFGTTSPMGSGLMGSAGMGGTIMERAVGMGSGMASSVGLPNPMGSMNVPTSSLPYPYSQYSPSAASYTGGPPGGFPYSPAHSLHMPSPNYPYPSPYGNAPYPQPGYLQNPMLERIKQDRMDIGFGGF